MALPLRGFYSTARAAELLGCTEDDFIHWAMTGNIRLYILIEGGYCYVDPYQAANFACHDKLFDFVSSLQYLDESKKEVFLGFDDSLGKFNEVAERIVYIIENRLGGISAIDNLDVRDFYQSFTYKTNLCVSDDFCILNSVLFFYNSLEWELKNLARYGIDSSTPNLKYYATARGFWGVDVYNLFNAWKFCPLIQPNKDNRIYAPDSNFSVSLLTDKEIKFDIDDLYLSKSDFLTIKSVINNEGSDGVMPKKYSAYIMSNLHKWRASAFGTPTETDSKSTSQDNKLTHSKPKSERVSGRMRDALALLIGEYLSDVKDQPTKIATALEAIAEKNGKKFTISKDTITNWLKR
ncbi:hypothetical protein PX993_002053 [Escherichia coli]|uniref:hypothetical protein n=1 Tax=Escherichia coli TaxID=562 RepID=UPI000BB5BEAF|nr:hypothetical protein [Escherichia coli]EFE1580221.1 hypothetical protein [Escherichia coli]EFF8739121.1 hypothetical protein [Escherichia coli]EFM7828073.1 hypothetical protein [Escherichia coli]EIP8409838.1 hypothetical protein [Escherichia coli]EIT0138753.1 hypothetical protein [Escherichia coli]